MRSIYSLFLLTLFILTGCSNPFHPNLDNNGTGNPEYTVATTPDEVLKNLALAYNRQDINIYKLCLAKDFRFELLAFDVNEIGIDMNGDGINDSWWDYDHELAYHANLFRKGTIMSNGYPAPDAIHLTLDVPPSSQWEKDPIPGHETWVIITCSFQLQLNYTTQNDIASAFGYARFWLKPDNGYWYIAIWRDESLI